MRKSKDTLMKIGFLSVIFSCGSGLAYGLWCSWCHPQERGQPNPIASNQTSPAADESTTEAARRARRSTNFNNILRF